MRLDDLDPSKNVRDQGRGGGRDLRIAQSHNRYCL